MSDKDEHDSASILLPPRRRLVRLHIEDTDEAAQDSFSVDAQGYGSVTGLAYTVPAHADGNVIADIRYLSLTSADVANLNELMRGMVSASQYQHIEDYEATHASANLSYWGFFSGGGSASYDKTHHEMRGFGLSEDNIKTIVQAMAEIAKTMSRVQLNITVHNSNHNYAVSGNLLIYTVAGSIKTGNQQTQYRMLANEGTYGSGSKTAPATVDVIPLN